MPFLLPPLFCRGKRRIGKPIYRSSPCYTSEQAITLLSRRSWTQLMQGTSSVRGKLRQGYVLQTNNIYQVIEAMDPWKHESQFTDFIEESSTFPTAPPSPTPDHKPCQPHQEDLAAYERTLQQLQRVETYLKQRREDTKDIVKLIGFLKGARKVSPSLSVSQQFERLRPLRTWMFYLPVMCLQQTHGSASTLIIIAHYYTVALVMERLFPEIGAAYFGSMAIGPVEEIARRLQALSVTAEHDGDLQTPLALMQYPLETVTEFRSRMGWAEPIRTPSFPQYNDHSCYINTGSPLLVPVATAPLMIPYGNNMAFSYSTDSLSLVTPDSGPNSATSPLQLSSPYVNQQYLSIPSPSYGGYSPASSSFGGDFGEASSIVYSDAEEYNSFDVGLSATSPMLGGSNNYGVGFVPPIQTVWT